MRVKTDCKFNIMYKYNISQMTLKQVTYLKKFDGEEHITISQLSEDLDLSKPTITEMVKKFIKLDYIRKEQCHHDARVYYLYLTEKGKRIARLEQIVNENLARRVLSSLSKEDIDLLIEILLKIV